MSKKNIVIATAIICSGTFAVLPYTYGHESSKDHDLAKQALINGDVLSLQEILNLVSKQQNGRPIKIGFDHDKNGYVYKIKLLRDNGDMAKIKVDATSGHIINVKERSKH